MSNIIIITNGNYFSMIVLEDIIKKYKEELRGFILVYGDYNGKTGIQSLFNVMKKIAIPYIIFKITCIAYIKILNCIKKDRLYDVEKILKYNKIDYIKTSKINLPNIIEYIQSKEPDLLISVSCPQRIRSSILSIPKKACINVHYALLPKYAGIAPYYWSLVNNESIVGATVHYMTEEFDDGDILSQKQYAVPKGVSAFRLAVELAKISSAILKESIPKALNKEKGQMQDLEKRTYYSHPTNKSYIQLRKNGYKLLKISDLTNLYANKK